MIRQLSDNPFRTLGVYSNSSVKDIVANKGKMNAFLKVGKNVSFPLDLTSLLGGLTRTPESIAAADSLLTIENDKLLSAQFWFINSASPFDQVAFNHIASGNIDAAIEAWGKKESMSSLQNMAVCYLVKNDIRSASRCLSVVYDRYRQEFVSAIGINHDVPASDLVEGYISSVLKSEGNIDFSLLSNPDCSGAWNSVAKKKMVEPLIKQLSDAVAKSKQSKGKGPQARLASGRELNKMAKKLLFELRQLLPTTDLQFVSMSDKVANEVLQCGIDFYNDSESPFAAYDSLELQNAASMLAMGTVAKDRCRENCDILKKNMESLPPKSVEKEHIGIQQALKKYCECDDKVSYAVTLVDETIGLLASIRQKLGAGNEYYVRQSTLVVSNALCNIISDVNATQKAYNDAVSGSSTESAAKACYVSTVKAAFDLMNRLGSFDMNAEVRQKFNSNMSTLRDIHSTLQSGGTSGGSSSGDDNTLSSAIIQILIYLAIGVAIFFFSSL